MKRKTIPLRCVFFLSLFGVIEGSNGYHGGMRGVIEPSLLSRSNEQFTTGLGSCTELALLVHSSKITPFCTHSTCIYERLSSLRGGGAAALNPFPSGYNPFGYGLTDFGKEYLAFNGSLDSDVGRFLSTLKGGQRKTEAVMKEQWLEIVRVSKKGQSMRIYRTLDDLIKFCLAAGFID
mmetsp:Transcript_6059/g.11057  ORF Transcript_6059/g.11057 Transcript_6059/m.11057 type:complete len:178 (+) Transcript_6059:69-602(+)